MTWKPLHRPRRNRLSANVRELTRESRLLPNQLIQPLFVHAYAESQPIASMPGMLRLSPDGLVTACERLAALGIQGVAIFPCIDASLKDPLGQHALAPDNLLYDALRRVKAACPDLLVIADVAMDPYTSHGHDGLLTPDGKDVANDATVEVLQKLAVREAEAGADWVAPSDMMDGRIAAIRHALDDAGFEHTGILSYAAKYASAFYGPFRDAVGSSREGGAIDKRSYQMDPANVREAVREARLDEGEGADVLMVKPAGPYLDVIRAVREASILPIAAYQVSGEYAQIHAAAQLGWLDYERTRDESLLAIKRAGADMILTYFAGEVAAGPRTT